MHAHAHVLIILADNWFAAFEKVISFRITKDDDVHDTKKFGPVVKEAAEKHGINKVYADKAYDNRKKQLRYIG